MKKIKENWLSLTLVAVVLVFSSFKAYNPDIAYYYNTAGRIVTPSGQHVAIFDDYVTPTAAAGQVIDYSSAHFVSAPVITLTAEQNTTAVTNIPLVSIQTKTATSCTVNLLSSNNQVVSVLGTNVTGLVAATTLSNMRVHIRAKGFTSDN